MKGMWVGYDVGCTMGLTCGHGAWQIDRQSNGSMWNSYSFQPVGQWMSYSFTDLGAEGCCRSLNALFSFMAISDVHRSCLTEWISKFPGSFEIHSLRQYLENFTGLAGLVNTTVYKTELTFTVLRQGKSSNFLTLEYPGDTCQMWIWFAESYI